MSETWFAVISVVVIGFGVAAELNLLRSFVRERRDARRGEEAPDTAPERPAWPRPISRVTHPRLAAFMLAPGMMVGSAMAQDSGATLRANDASISVQPQANQSNPAKAAEPQPARAPDATGSAFSLQLNLDVTNAYFYHGIVQEDTGFILQPAAKVTMNVHDAPDLKIDLLVATWNSFQSQKTNAGVQGDFTPYWYESDLIAGFVVTSGKASLTTTYTFLTSPSDAYQTVQELDFNFGYDDSEALGAYALHPYALLGIETGSNGSDGVDSEPGVYLELGIAPGFSFETGKTPVAITFPASIGLSLKDYYENAAGENDVFGFVQVGVEASIPLPIADRYGKWTVNAGVAGMYLGDNTSEYNGGKHEQFIGTVGLQLNF